MSTLSGFGNWCPYSEEDRVNSLNADSKYYKYLASVASKSLGFGKYSFCINFNNSDFTATYKRERSRCY